MSLTSNNWAMLLHFSTLLAYPVPLVGLAAPILIWQLKKDEIPALEPHGKMVANFVISLLIYNAIAFVLACAFIGWPLLIVLAVIAVVFPIIGGIKANNGELWKYPLTLNLIR